MSPQQAIVNDILNQIKPLLLQMLNETADEFDEMELTEDQAKIYNEFTTVFGEKVLSMTLIVQADE